MGYTHYYSVSPKVKRLPVDSIRVMFDLLAEQGHGDLVTVERLDPCRIVLHDAGPDPYESLVIHPPHYIRGRHRRIVCDETGWSWDFTKTARRPYDVVICAILARLQVELGPDLFSFTSDGISRPYRYSDNMNLMHDRTRVVVEESWPEVFRMDLCAGALPTMLDRKRREAEEGDPARYPTKEPPKGWQINAVPGAVVYSADGKVLATV